MGGCLSSGIPPEGKRLMQPSEGQLLLKLRWAAVMALRLMGRSQAPQ